MTDTLTQPSEPTTAAAEPAAEVFEFLELFGRAANPEPQTLEEFRDALTLTTQALKYAVRKRAEAEAELARLRATPEARPHEMQ